MLKVGLTGGIGAGKSTVAERLVRRGAVLIDSDVLARGVVTPGSEGLREIVAAFGPGVLDADGVLDRPALGARVFGDDDARRALERIIHPRVRARAAELAAAAPADSIVVNDVPLLVETGQAARYHLVVVVAADERVRVDRLVATRGMTRDEAYARIRAQATDQRRADAADVLLDNDGPVDDLDAAIDRLWHERLVPYERNLRTGHPARWPAATLVEPDATWPAQAARLTARLAAAFGPDSVRIDHVGPTAVPGLPAEDVIDLQVVVADRAAAGRVVANGRTAGLVRTADECATGGTGPAVGRLTNADPGRPVLVTVWEVGDASWREALLLRDWLRAEPSARPAHATVARGHGTARQPGAGQSLVRARRWAVASGWAP